MSVHFKSDDMGLGGRVLDDGTVIYSAHGPRLFTLTPEQMARIDALFDAHGITVYDSDDEPKESK